MKNIVAKVLVPLAIVAGGGATAAVMIKSAQSADPAPPAVEPPLVEVVSLSYAPGKPIVTGTGVVEPARQVSVSPEVAGRVKSISPSLVVGGRFEQGEVMARIDDRDYRIAIRQQRNQVKQAQLELEVEEGRSNVAQREWKLLSDGGTALDGELGRLARREPYQEAAKMGVDAARSGLERARLDLSRTVIKAPFNATVIDESVEVGQVVSSNGPLATLVGTDEIWIRVSVPVESLRLIDVPSLGASCGSKARVTQVLGDGESAEWTGEVIRLVNELDPESRTAQLLVSVPDPFDPEPGGLPLLPGAFVNVQIDGPALADVIRVPRVALVDGSSVWVVGAEDRIDKRSLAVSWGDDDSVYVTSGLEAKDRVVTGGLSLPLEGMEVRPRPGEDPTRIADTGDAEKVEG